MAVQLQVLADDNTFVCDGETNRKVATKEMLATARAYRREGIEVRFVSDKTMFVK